MAELYRDTATTSSENLVCTGMYADSLNWGN